MMVVERIRAVLSTLAGWSMAGRMVWLGYWLGAWITALSVKYIAVDWFLAVVLIGFSLLPVFLYEGFLHR